jgi:hypothetical protein
MRLRDVADRKLNCAMESVEEKRMTSTTTPTSVESFEGMGGMGGMEAYLMDIEHCYSVYQSGYAFAVMLLCVAVCAPSDRPRVPDPVRVCRARSVYAAVYAARAV